MVTLNQKALELPFFNVVPVSVHRFNALLACCSLTAKQENGLSGLEIEEFLTIGTGKATGGGLCVHVRLFMLVSYLILL